MNPDTQFDALYHSIAYDGKFNTIIRDQLNNKAKLFVLVAEVKAYIQKHVKQTGYGIPSTANEYLRHEYMVGLTKHILKTGWPDRSSYLTAELDSPSPQPAPCAPPLPPRPEGSIVVAPTMNHPVTEEEVPEKVMAQRLIKDRGVFNKIASAISAKQPSHHLQKLVRDGASDEDWSKVFTLSTIVWIHHLLGCPPSWNYLHLPKHNLIELEKEKETKIMSNKPWLEISINVTMKAGGSSVDYTDPKAILNAIASKEAEIKQMQQTTAKPKMLKDAIAKAEDDLAKLLEWMEDTSLAAAQAAAAKASSVTVVTPAAS